MNPANDIQTKTDIALVRVRGKIVRKALEAFSAYATNPGMENEIGDIIKQIESIENEMVKDLLDPKWDYR